MLKVQAAAAAAAVGPSVALVTGYPTPIPRACVSERGSRRVRQSIRPAERFLLCARGESGLSSSVRRQEEVAFAAAAAVVVGGGGVHGGHRAQEVWALTCLNPTR